MQFLPLSEAFDPECPRSEKDPSRWLKENSPRWAFPRHASDDEIHSYVVWLHVHRVGVDVTSRAKGMSPSLAFRLRILLHRIWFFVRAFDGRIPAELLKEKDNE